MIKSSSTDFESMTLFGDDSDDLTLSDDLELSFGMDEQANDLMIDDDLELPLEIDEQIEDVEKRNSDSPKEVFQGEGNMENLSEDKVASSDLTQPVPSDLTQSDSSKQKPINYINLGGKGCINLEDFENSKTVLDYSSISDKTLNNVHLDIKPRISLQEEILDYKKLTPICYEFLGFMITEGYVPNKEKFRNYCKRCLSYFSFVEKNCYYANFGEEPRFSFEELFTISQYLKVKRNIFIDADYLMVYIDYPLKFFNAVTFPFRKSEISEILLISNVYDKDWYVPYIVPLFSLKPEHTELLIELMEKEMLNERELLRYCGKVQKQKEYLILKKDNSFVEELFDEIESNPKNLEMYATLSGIINDLNIVRALFVREVGEKTKIISFIEKINESNSDIHTIRLKSGGYIDLDQVLSKHIDCTYLPIILEGLVNGIYNETLINTIMSNYFGNKSITLCLMNYYANHENLSNYFDKLHSLDTSIIATEIESFGYNIKKFLNDATNLYRKDYMMQLFDVFLLRNLEDSTMSVQDYKQWIALFSLDYLHYAEVISNHPNYDVCHFNRFWAKYAANYFGFPDTYVGTGVLRSLVFKVNSKTQINFPLEFFIYMDSQIEEILNKQLKPFIQVARYDHENDVLFFGQSNLFGKHSKPPLLFKTSLENLGDSELDNYDFPDKTVLIRCFNLLKLKNNIAQFYQSDSKDYQEKIANFDRNIQYLIALNYFDYIAYDLIFYAIANIEKEYSLLACCNDVNVFYECLKIFQNIYFGNSDSLIAFTKFVYGVFGQNFSKVNFCCKSKLITVLHDNKVNSIYDNPISFAIFLKELDYFRKSAKSTKATVTLDRVTGGLCIDYNLQ